MYSLPPAQRNRPWTMDELVARGCMAGTKPAHALAALVLP